MAKQWFQEEAIAHAKAYHHDNTQFDPRYDQALVLGRFEGDWDAEVKQLIEDSKALTFNTRGWQGPVYYHPPRPYSNEKQGDHEQEEKEFFDKVGYGEDYYKYEIINKANPINSPTLMKMVRAFGFGEPWQCTVHIQTTGQCFPWHYDIFQNREGYGMVPDPRDIMRVQVMMDDWVPGQWFGYGTGTYTHWKKGDFHTFDLDHTAHYTANASYTPRVNLMITGVRTEETAKFLKLAQNTKAIKVDDL
jgi:hypothetical protein